MWSGRRSALEIFASILTSLMESPLKKTHLTYKANLDSRLASRYINSLIKLEFISKSSTDPSFYTITPTGRDFLKQYNELFKKIESHA